MPRAGLSAEIVAAGAATIVDEDGVDALKLATVAERFGVAVPSLYKHVGGLDDLRRRVAVLAATELGDTLRQAAMGRADGDALRAVAGAYRRYAAGHPGRYAIMQRAPAEGDREHEAASDDVLAVIRTVLDGYGITGGDAIDAIRAVRSALHGFVSLEAAGGFGLPHDVDRSYDRLVSALDAAFRSW